MIDACRSAVQAAVENSGLRLLETPDMRFGNEIMQGTNGYRLPATDHRIVLRRGSTILWSVASVAGSPVISLKLSVIALTHWLSFDRGIMHDSSPDALKDLKQFA